MQTFYDKLASRLSGTPAQAHFTGIGGVGMAGVAFMLKKLGWSVSGCDSTGNDLLDWLNANGISTETENSPAHLQHLSPQADLVIRTPAVALSSPELEEAVNAGIPVYDRGVLLAVLSGRHDTIAVCGTHGKTTTSSFIAGILNSLIPEKTSWCIGGISPFLGTVAGGSGLAADSEGGFLVAEADESDGTLALYKPYITVLNNLDLDHLEHFRDTRELEDVFRSALSRTSHTIIYCADHPRATAVAMEPYKAQAISFGFSEGADYHISGGTYNELNSQFMLSVRGGQPIPVSIGVPGRHNVLNATAAIAAACAAGLNLKTVCEALAKTAVLPARRFEKIGSPQTFTVISDYSHHPAEIAALIETAQSLPHRRVLGIFQPHRFTRTKTLLKSFPVAFVGLDQLILCPVYAASEDPIPGGTSADLYGEFRVEAEDNNSIPIPLLAQSLESASAYLRAILQPGDLVLVIGAGDVNHLAAEIAAAQPVQEEPRPLRLGAFGTEAIAPNLKVIKTLAALQDIVKRGHFSVLAAGTNTFVSATGCHGTLIRLSGSTFDTTSVLSETPETVELEVGAAVQGPGFLRFCAEHGYSGLEFMAGIPGMCGGWLAMNAGTRFGSFCDAVTHVEAIGPDGIKCQRDVSELNATYRSCPGIKGLVAYAIRLKLRRSTQESVRHAMDEAIAHRMDFSGIRTGGSVFKNPGGTLPPAGMILEKAGCKGMRIGGAFVTNRHANVIAAEPNATASDVYALMTLMREQAFESSGIRLEPEIRILN